MQVMIRTVVSASLTMLILACGGESSELDRSQQPKAEESATVAVSHIQRGEAASYYTTTATLEAEYKAEIRSRTEGIVRELIHEEGDDVEAGELLLVIEDSDQVLRLRQAQIQAEQAKAEFVRRKSMTEAGFLSSQEFELTENALKQAEAELELATLMLSYTRVTAPFTGTVTRRSVDLGANISSGAALFNMMDMDPLLVKVFIPATRMGFVKVGQDLEIEVESNETHLTGHVRLISPIVDSETGTVKVTAEIRQYPAATRPGDFANISIITHRSQNALLVPTTAIIEDQGSHHVFITQDSRAFKRIVSIGFADRGQTEITNGLGGDELIVVKGQRNLKDGMAVEILSGPDAAVTAKVEAGP